MFVVNLIVVSLMVLSGIFYIKAILKAIELTKNKKPKDMPEESRLWLVGIGGLLATNFGAVCGITANDIKNFGFQTDKMLLFQGVDTPGFIQVIMALFYLVCLAIAYRGYSKYKAPKEPDIVVPELKQLAFTFYGVAIGAVAVGLS